MGAKKSRTNNDGEAGQPIVFVACLRADVPQSVDFRDSKGDPAWWLGSG